MFNLKSHFFESAATLVNNNTNTKRRKVNTNDTNMDRVTSYFTFREEKMFDSQLRQISCSRF
ncbi:hypothetical protein T4B_12737 [Trichinella pseudospiralis]|uniref:Uncharacterized protein n=1 Tax=Trichinella pseudospiralis TaxID=6337 RepID=A0A0V1IJ87_TRIPS|nr:hypothetical protein T4B_12737 [Trichinella pseudospiralis]